MMTGIIFDIGILEGDYMSDFEMIYLFLTFCLVIIGILELTHKK